MKVIRLLPVGKVDIRLLDSLIQPLSGSFSARVEIADAHLDAEFAFNTQRQQYHSTEILARMHSLHSPSAWRFLGVASVDLFIPILTFVFGEAQLNNPCALISSYRLRQEYYGLPQDDALLGERLKKEGLHELGHTVGLVHCSDYSCVMSSAHAVEYIDLRDSSFCAACRSRAGLR